MKESLLLVDDDDSFREVMRFHLVEAGYHVDTARDGAGGLRIFQEKLHPVVLTDLKMPGMDGIELLKQLMKRSPDTVVVVITAFGDIDTAVKAMKAGAFDFIPKPTSRDHYKLVVKKAFQHVGLKTRVKELESRKPSETGELVFQSRAMEKVVDLAERVAPSDAAVLIQGESGTGKEILAKRIHLKSDRASGPFVAVNCASLPGDLLESELFGHVKGAFTGAHRDHKGKFQQASGGTIFLDEIGELPVHLQPRLLRVLQEHTIDMVGGEKTIEVDVRVIAATNRDLKQAVEQGTFREDLFFRLNVVPIEIPPLRTRKEDIAVLVSHFLAKYGRGKKYKLTREFLDALESHHWPGNVRELESICLQVTLLADDDELKAEYLPVTFPHAEKRTGSSAGISTGRGDGIVIEIPAGGAPLEEIEKKIIIEALKKNGYNQSKTARFLGIPRHKLLYRIEKYEIPEKE